MENAGRELAPATPPLRPSAAGSTLCGVPSFEGHGRIVRRRTSLLVAALAGYAGFLVGVVTGIPVWIHIVCMLVASATMAQWSLHVWPSRRAGRVRGDALGLSLDGRFLLERRRIDAATTMGDQPKVRIWRRGRGTLDVELESTGDAAALVKALGLATGQSIATFSAAIGGKWVRVGVPGVAVLALLLVQVLTVLTSGPIGAGPFLLQALVLGPVLFAILALRARVLVGSDGILVGRTLFRSRFIPYGAIASVQCVSNEIFVHLRAGPPIVLTTGAGNRTQNETREGLVAARIEEARAAHASRTGSESAEALLAPGGRPVETWLREVRTLASAQQYREAMVDPQRLLRVATDAAAPAATRAGAALALAPAMGDDDRARLRVASETCADPRLRVALLRVAEGAPPEDVDEAVAAVATRQEGVR